MATLESLLKKGLALTLLMSLWPGYSIGAEGSQMAKKAKKSVLSFAEMDSDTDGVINIDEYKLSHMGWLEAKFKNIDKNSNGKIEKNELQAFRNKGKKKFQKKATKKMKEEKKIE